jgi:hypothetical protein
MRRRGPGAEAVPGAGTVFPVTKRVPTAVAFLLAVEWDHVAAVTV